MNETKSTQVLIIGGGPSGMVSALHLDKLGIQSILVERQFEIAQHPKAHELSARSIEILGQLGITMEELKKEAAPYRDGSRILFGYTVNQELGEIDLMAGGNDKKYQQHLAAPEPYLNLSQTELEKILRSKLVKATHAQVLIGHQWEAMSNIEEGVESTILDRKNKTTFNIKSKYVICADGAGSRSRKALGIEMKGEEKLDDFISVYFELNLRDFIKKSAKLYWIMNPYAPGTFIAHHIEKRWVYHFPIYMPYENKEQYTEEILRQRILTALGDDTIPLKIHSIDSWRMTCQIGSFRQGNVFFVGDAAHRFPPTGGLGMNSGIGDVQNLCWKLAWVLKGWVHRRLLHTYQAERLPVIELNAKESLRNYDKIKEVPAAMGMSLHGLKYQAIVMNNVLIKALPKSWSAGLLKMIQGVLAKKILNIPNQPELHQKVKVAINDQIEHFDRIGLDLGYVYEKGAVVLDEKAQLPKQTVSQYQPSILAGVRFPHFWVEEGNERYSSHNWLALNKYLLLCNDKGEAWWEINKGELDSKIVDFIKVKNVTTILNNQPKDALERTFYHIDQTPIVLIRPDGHIAWTPSDLKVDIKDVFLHLSLTAMPSN